MSYELILETFSGTVKKMQFENKNAVNSFIATYPQALPVGQAVKVTCDLLGVRGTLRGAKK